MVKLRMQVQRSGYYNFGYKNIFHGLFVLQKQESFRSYFKAAGARVLSMAPMTSISLALYESCTRFYRNLLYSNHID